MPRSPVLIVGAGLGGLCLAQALKKHDIPFRIFEKDERLNFRAQGYRLRIILNGVTALEYALSPDVWSLFENTCPETARGGVRLRSDDATALDPTAMGGGPPKGMMDGKVFTVDRTTFREVLLTGLEDRMCFGKRFDHYVVHPDRVTAYFHDGSSEDGSLLVGADGVRSQVRKQYLPHLPVMDTGMRILYGKTRLSPQFKASPFPGEALTGMSLVIDDSIDAQKSLLLEVIRFRRDLSPSITTPEDYIYWVLLAHRSVMPFPDDELLRLDHAQSADLACRLTERWHQRLRPLFTMQDQGQTSTLRVSSAAPDLPSWDPSPRVTVLGDAIHVMPPTGAMGANTALRDAADLARRIVEVAPGGDEVNKRLVGEYEAELRVSAKEAIEASWRGGRKSFGLRSMEECEVIDV